MRDNDIYYPGELGCLATSENTMFKVWAPQAQTFTLRLYAHWEDLTPFEVIKMDKIDQGVWFFETKRCLFGTYYTFEAQYDGKLHGEAIDPYARSVSPNGYRAYIFDQATTNPQGWQDDRAPHFAHPVDAVIYELHIRDLSSLASSGIQHKGQFLGLTEIGTKSPQNLSTGLDHLKELGITHLHLLPLCDWDDLDDLTYDPQKYNWGYNPRNYNALKGAYSSNPRDPSQAIRDFKTLVQTLHSHGIRVVVDMVYNHTFASADSNFHKLVPGYYHRMYEGHFSNGSGCGNEIASENPMCHRMILDSLKYWAQEFHLDGFRFDLLGLTDIETVNNIAHEMEKHDPSFLVYGEGWIGGLSTLPEERRAIKQNAKKVRDVAFFSDDARDAIKGHVFQASIKGFANGGEHMEESIKFATVACTQHPQIDHSKLIYSREAWSSAPHQTVNYAAAHDNHTLWDKLKHTNPQDSDAEISKMHRLANTIVFTSQGIPFLHAGEEFLRTKMGVENSYNHPDSINGIDWNLKSQHKEVFEYYRGLIVLRKSRPALRLRSSEQIQHHLRFIELCEPRMLAFVLLDHAGGDPAEKVLVLYNAHNNSRDVTLPKGDWNIVLNHEKAGNQILGQPSNGVVTLPGLSAMVLVTPY